MDNEILVALKGISTDVSWIKIQAEQANVHLAKINGTVAQNCIDIETGRTNDKWLWRVMTIVIIGLIGFILQYFLR